MMISVECRLFRAAKSSTIPNLSESTLLVKLGIDLYLRCVAVLLLCLGLFEHEGRGTVGKAVYIPLPDESTTLSSPHSLDSTAASENSTTRRHPLSELNTGSPGASMPLSGVMLTEPALLVLNGSSISHPKLACRPARLYLHGADCPRCSQICRTYLYTRALGS